ncbi:MAG: endonuclease/exonuclease/phosphatase family protein [Geminicoccaceae bacterium]|nr:endonuclease/exonuclease/phosphatase family protein [Geminicoccaceae bacterium]
MQGTGLGVARTIVVVLALVLIAASSMPLLETNAWWVRVLDFPRLHYLIGFVVLALLCTLLGCLRTSSGRVVLALIVLAAGYNVYKMYPYVPWRASSSLAAEACSEGSRLRVLSVNVQMGNHQADELLQLVGQHDPDLLFAMETDAWWNEQLAALGSRYSEQVDHFDNGEGDYFGLHLLSKFPLVDPEVRFLTRRDAPSVFTGIRLPNGERIDFFGIHPRPPTIDQSSLWRDTQILAAAAFARESEHPVVLAGDLNAVPWERVVRRALRVGDLIDPRAGRGYLASYNAEQPWFWWPLDHVLFQDELALLVLRRLPNVGSDHYPVLADLCLLPSAASQRAAPALEEGDLAEVSQTLQAGLRSGAPAPALLAE